MPFGKSKKSSGKVFPVCVTTMDAELEFHLDLKATGRDLFDLVCRTIGLREVWYFGLQYIDSEGFVAWLKLDKKVRAQEIPKKMPVNFLFLAKFYPEDMAEELLQEITQHLFFLQVKQAVLNMDIYCQPEASVLLASYAVQAKYGDYDEASYKPGILINEDLLPQRVINKYEMTPEMWEERIKSLYADHRGTARDEAELEYLKIAQDLDMCGVTFFPICNKESELWIGVTALGLNIYEKANKLSPKSTFPWSEIRNISFDNKKFTLKSADKSMPSFQFYASKTRINKLILDLCIGNHYLFMCRRKPDSMEIQQMKAQAKEERDRRQIERNKLALEKQLREEVEKEKADLQQRMIHVQEEARVALEALRRSEETAELLAEKARIVEEEAMLLTRKASDPKAEIRRIKFSAIKTEEEKKLMEIKVHEAELLVTKMVQESEHKAQEAEKLKVELIKAQLSEKNAKEKLQEISMVNYSRPYLPNMLDTVPRQYSVLHTENNVSSDTVNYDLIQDLEIEELTQEFEKEKAEYLEKSKHLHKHLLELKTKIEVFKDEDNISFFR
nr:merlin-like [Parasteatoda tepidariorum]